MTASLTALTLAGTIGLSAQTPQTPQQTRPMPAPATSRPMTDDRQPPTVTSDQAVTVTGCLKDEKDVPGRRPNAAERAGVMNDYILTNVKMAQSATTSAIGLQSMYQVKGVAESELKSHVGHQVEITGKLEAKAPSKTTGNSDLPDLHADSVKMLAATCAQ